MDIELSPNAKKILVFVKQALGGVSDAEVIEEALKMMQAEIDKTSPFRRLTIFLDRQSFERLDMVRKKRGVSSFTRVIRLAIAFLALIVDQKSARDSGFRQSALKAPGKGCETSRKIPLAR